jgi:hypothetical protein
MQEEKAGRKKIVKIWVKHGFQILI